jgi:hypothetical protein
MDVFALTMRLKEDGAGAVKASVDKLRDSMNTAATGATKLDSGISSLSSVMVKLGSALAVGAAFRKLIDATSEAQFAQAQLQSALKSTGFAAGQSITALNDHAVALQRMTAFGDDAINGAQSLLLTFTKIRGDVFPKATTAVVDMAQAMGTDLKSAALQVGKALNDPVLGVGALARAGVQFSEQQKEMIKSLVETGNVAKAQAIILKELETQFGGSAEAARKTLGGALAALRESFGDLFEVSDTGTKDVVTGINSIIAVLTDLKSWMDRNNVFGLLVREVALVAQAIGDAVKWFQMLGQQSDATGKFIDGMAEVMRGVNNLSKETIANGRAMMASARNEYSAIQQRMGALIAESRSRETATRAMSNYKGVLDGVLGSITSDYNKRGEQAAALNAVADATKKVTVAEAAAHFAKMAQFSQQKLLDKRGMIVGPMSSSGLKMPRFDVSSITTPLDTAEAEALARFDEFRSTLGTELRNGLITTLADSIGAAFEVAVATGSVTEGFKALGKSMLSGLGGMLQMFGTQALVASKLMASLMVAFKSLNPAAQIAASIGLIALGGMLKGAASSAFGGGGGSGGRGVSVATMGGGYGGSMGSSGQTLPTLTYGPTSAAGGSSIRQASSMNVTIIGPNDPSAQRAMQELMTKADRRGNV